MSRTQEKHFNRKAYTTGLEMGELKNSMILFGV